MGFSRAVYTDFETLVGKPHITRKKEELLCYSYDATGRSFLPEAVIFPETQTQISQIFKIACQHGIPVIPRGAGSGMTGGAVPVQGGIVWQARPACAWSAPGHKPRAPRP